MSRAFDELTVRDHFASAAVSSLIQRGDAAVKAAGPVMQQLLKAAKEEGTELEVQNAIDETFRQQLAEEAYAIADAMLVERAKVKDGA